MDGNGVTDVRQALQSALASLDLIETRIALALSELRETEIRLRRARSQFFPSGYFSDVAWDILLELDKAERLRRVFSVSDVGVDAAIPISTLLRYVAKLETDGFVTRAQDPNDGRRAFVSLTDAGREALSRVFDAATGTTAFTRFPEHAANDSSIELIRSA